VLGADGLSYFLQSALGTVSLIVPLRRSVLFKFHQLAWMRHWRRMASSSISVPMAE